MVANEIVSQARRNGSVDAWLEGWHVHFPADDQRPTVEAGSSPDSLKPGKAGLSAEPFGARQGIRHGSWIVTVSADDFKVIYVDPEADDEGTQHHYLYRI